MPRLLPKEKRWPCDRDRQRLQMARRQVDNEPGDLTAADPFQLVRDRGYVPVRQVGRSRVECHKTASEEQFEVPPQNDVVKRLFYVRHFFLPPLLGYFLK